MADQNQYGADGTDDPFLSDLIFSFTKNASTVINAETDPDKKAALEQRLQDKVQAIAQKYHDEGAAPFQKYFADTQAQKAKSDISNPAPWQQDNWTGQLPNSPLKSNIPTQPNWVDHATDQIGGVSDAIEAKYPGMSPLLGAAKGVVGGAEGMASLGSGLIAPVAGGIAGLGTAASNELHTLGGHPELNTETPVDAINRVSDELSFQPRDAGGAAAADALTKPFQLLKETGDYAADRIMDAKQLDVDKLPDWAKPIGWAYNKAAGNPAFATAATTAVQMLPTVAGGEGSRIRAAEKGAAEKNIGSSIDNDLSQNRLQDVPKTGDATVDTGIDLANQMGKDLYSGPLDKLPTPTTTIPYGNNAPDLTKASKLNQPAVTSADVSFGTTPAEAAISSNPANMSMGDALRARRDRIARGDTPDVSSPPNAEVTTEPGPLEKKWSVSSGKKPIIQAQPDLDLTGKEDTTSPQPTEATIPTSKEGLRAALQEKVGGRPVAAIGDDPSHYNRLPASIVEAHEKGELTAGHVLDSAADNHEGLFDNDPTQQGLAEEMRKNGEQLGGLDAKVELIPTDPEARSAEHNEVIKRNNEFATQEGKPLWDDAKGPKGVYDPQNKKIYINGPESMDHATLLHESTHAVTHAAIQAGMDGKLTGTRLSAYNAMQNLFEATKNVAGRDAGRYGFTDLHEFAAELRSNPTFRKALNNIPLDAVAASKMGFGRLLVGKISNAYQAAVAGLSKMIGLSDKAKTAFDAAISTSESFFKSFTKAPEEAGRMTAKQYEPPVKDPLSTRQVVGEKIKFAARRLLTSVTTIPEKTARAAKVTAQGAMRDELRKSFNAAKDIQSTAKAEGADSSKIADYMRGTDPTALDQHPNTKAAVDEGFIRPREEMRKQLVKLVLDNPKSTKADLLFAHKVWDNPDYVMRSYGPADTSRNTIVTAEAVNRRLAKDPNAKVTPAEMDAKRIYDSAIEFMKREYLPTDDMSNRTISGLRTMAKGLGVDTVQELGNVPKEGKRAALEAAIRRAVPGYEAADKAVRNLVYEAAGILNKGGTGVASYYRGLRVGDIFTARKSVPPEIKALWGEDTSPAALVVQTRTKMARGIAQLEQQKTILDAGHKDGYLFDNKNTAPAGFTEQLTGRKFGYLRGQWTSPEVKQMLNSHVEIATAANTFSTAIHSGNPLGNVTRWALDKTMSAALVIPRTYKLYTLTTDPTYFAMYAAGGPAISLMHGTTNLAAHGMGLMAHIAEIAPGFTKLLSKGLQEKVEAHLSDLTKMGLTEPSSTGEIFSHYEKLKLADAANKTDAGWHDVMMALPKDIFDRASKGAMHGLSLMDGWARRGVGIDRVKILTDLYARNNIPMTHDAILKEAGDWIKDTVITNDRAPLLARASETLGGSRGLTYAVETLRNTWNAGAHSIADFQRGVKMNDKPLMIQGVKQMVGTITAMKYYAGAISAITGTAVGLAGLITKQIPATDERQKYLQQEGSHFRGERPETIEDPENPDPNNQYIYSPGNRFDYLYHSATFLNSLEDDYARYQAGEKLDPTDVASKAVSSFTGTFFRDALVNRLMTVAKGNLPGWMHNTPELVDQRKVFWANAGFSPESTTRMLALEDIGRAGTARNIDTANEMPTQSSAIKIMTAMGLGVNKIGNDADLSGYTGKAIKGELVDAKKSLDTVMTATAPFTPEQIEESYKNAFVKNYESLKKLKDDVAFADANKVPRGKLLYGATQQGGVPDDAILAATTGKLNPAELLYSDLTGKMEKELESVASDPAKEAKLTQLFIGRVKLLNQLTQQYAKLTPAQIEELR